MTSLWKPIEVTVESPSGRDVAECETAEDALYAARTLFDEARGDKPVQGFTASIVTTFRVDGKVVRMYEGRRP